MASLYDSASLVMIPSGVKEDKLFSIKPTDGSGDFTFSRDADIEATRVNSSGLIEKAKQNLLKYSQDFSNGAWIPAGSASISHGITDPNGGTTASRITSTATGNSGLYQVDATNFGSNNIRAASVWMKGAVGGEQVELGDATNRKIVTLTTSWVRYETFAIDSSAFFIMYSNSLAQTWDIAFAQYQDGLVAGDYVETTTTAVVEGLTADLPRLDYSGGASCPSLLLEPSRTNILTQSEYYGTTPYARTNASVTHNDLLSPEGVINATKLESNSNSSASRVETFPTLADDTDYTASIFAKRGNVDFIFINFRDKNDDQHGMWFDLSDGTKGTAQGTPVDTSIEAVGDYYRCSVTIDSSSGVGTPRLQYLVANTDNNVVTASGEYIHIYGAQIEAGSYPTSYIPTYGTAANRGGDLAIKSSATSVIGQTEGTLFFEVDNISADITTGGQLFSLDNGTNLERIEIYLTSGSPRIGVYVQRGSSQVAYNTDFIVSGTHKIALAYKENDYALYIDGVLKHTDTSASVPACNNVRLQGRYDNLMTGKHSNKQAVLFKTRLTNAELAALTA